MGRHAGPIDYVVLKQVEPDSAAQIQVLLDFQTNIRTNYARLIEMLEQGEQANVVSMVHRMKGSSRMVGAKDLANVCAAIEQAARDGDMNKAKAARKALDEAIEQIETYLDEAGSRGGR